MRSGLRSLLAVALAIALALGYVGLAGCSDSGQSLAAPEILAPPTPAITSLSPASARPLGPAFSLTVTGRDLTFDSIVRWNGNNRPTTVVTLNFGGGLVIAGLAADIPASDLAAGPAAAGSATVTAFTPPDQIGIGGGTSNALTFTIANPVPVLNSLSPISALEGGSSFSLIVTGQDFINGSVVRWDNVARTTGFVSATTLLTDILASEILTAGSVQVTVFNPGPGGGTSGPATFTITGTGTNPVPVLTSVSPSRPPSTSSPVTLTANGTGFVSGSVVHWNGSPRTTTFVSATTLTARILGFIDLDDEGVFHVTVVNPAPGGTSNAVPVLVDLPFSVGVEPGGLTSGGFGGTPSAGGRYVAFASNSTDLVVGGNDNNGVTDVFVRDMCLGAPPGCTPRTVRVSVSSAGDEATSAPGESGSGPPLAISSDGRFVAFTSSATNLVLVPVDVPGDEVFVHDRDADADGVFDEPGAIATVRASQRDTGAAVAAALRAMSPDGRFVVFTTIAPAVVADTNGGDDAYVRDRDSDGNGIYDEPGGVLTERISIPGGGGEMEMVADGDIASGALSGDGRFVAFTTTAGNLVPGDTNVDTDVFLRDRVSSSTTCTSVNLGGVPAGSAGDSCDVSPDGRHIAFASDATDLVPGDINQTTDVFVRDTSVGSTIAVSTATAAPGTFGPSILPAFGADGRLIVLLSADALPGTQVGFYRRDLTAVPGALERFGVMATVPALPVRPSPEGDFATYHLSGLGPLSFIDETGFVPGPALAPTIAAVSPFSPSSAAPASPAFTLTVSGSDFVPRSVVRWNGSDRATIFINRTTLRARIRSSDIASPGTASVTVFTPEPAGGISAAATFPFP